MAHNKVCNIMKPKLFLVLFALCVQAFCAHSANECKVLNRQVLLEPIVNDKLIGDLLDHITADNLYKKGFSKLKEPSPRHLEKGEQLFSMTKGLNKVLFYKSQYKTELISATIFSNEAFSTPLALIGKSKTFVSSEYKIKYMSNNSAIRDLEGFVNVKLIFKNNKLESISVNAILD